MKDIYAVKPEEYPLLLGESIYRRRFTPSTARKLATQTSPWESRWSAREGRETAPRNSAGGS